jgi:hypothetical protein
MFVPFVGAVHRHLKSWSLGAVLQCLERCLDEPAFRTTLIQKPRAFKLRYRILYVSGELS